MASHTCRNSHARSAFAGMDCLNTSTNESMFEFPYPNVQQSMGSSIHRATPAHATGQGIHEGHGRAIKCVAGITTAALGSGLWPLPNCPI